jgi:hypothetical protein
MLQGDEKRNKTEIETYLSYWTEERLIQLCIWKLSLSNKSPHVYVHHGYVGSPTTLIFMYFFTY